jgi:hypothetical protein
MGSLTRCAPEAIGDFEFQIPISRFRLIPCQSFYVLRRSANLAAVVRCISPDHSSLRKMRHDVCLIPK